MSQAALAHDALLPRPPGGNGAGAALALLVHGGLVVALTVSVDWRTHAPEVVSAELWASVPQVAAPRPVEPPSPPVPPPPAPAPTPAPTPAPPPQAAPPAPDADIATERRKQEVARKRAEAEAELERQRSEADKKKREQAEKNEKAEKAEKAAREAKAAEERLAQQREDYLRRMMGQAGTANAGTGTAAQDAAPSASYIGRLRKSVRDNIFFPGQTTPDNAAAEVEVSAAPGGTIISRRLVKSSGHKDWDDAVLRALDKLGKLPAPGPGEAAQTRLQLVLRPKEE